MVLPNDVFFDLLEKGSDPVLLEVLGIPPCEAFNNGVDGVHNLPSSSDGRFTQLDDIPQHLDSTIPPSSFVAPLGEITPNDLVSIPIRVQGESEDSNSKRETARKPRAKL
jgi:hypothetical protein